MPEEQFAATGDLYGADNVLVRPDQHVAWRGAHLPRGAAPAVLDLVLGIAPHPADAERDDRAALMAPVS